MPIHWHPLPQGRAFIIDASEQAWYIRHGALECDLITSRRPELRWLTRPIITQLLTMGPSERLDAGYDTALSLARPSRGPDTVRVHSHVHGSYTWQWNVTRPFLETLLHVFRRPINLHD